MTKSICALNPIFKQRHKSLRVNKLQQNNCLKVSLSVLSSQVLEKPSFEFNILNFIYLNLVKLKSILA